MKFDNFYKTNLETDDDKYEYNIGDEVIIDIILTDYNNKPVVDRNVVLKISKDEYQDEHIAMITLTTDGRGIASWKHTSDVPQRFVFECNDKRIMVSYDGWYLDSTDTGVSVYYSLDWVKVSFSKSIAVAKGEWKPLRMIKDEWLRPTMPVVTMVNWGNTLNCTVRDTGHCMVRDNVKAWTPNALHSEVVYPRRRR